MHRRLLAADVLACALLSGLAGVSIPAQSSLPAPSRPTFSSPATGTRLANPRAGVDNSQPGSSEAAPRSFLASSNQPDPPAQTPSQPELQQPAALSVGSGGPDAFDPFSGSLSGARPALNPLTQPDLSPQVIQLLELEARFSDETAKGGGKAFASWFAEDGVTLANKRGAVVGKAAIAAQARWEPEQYQLTWIAQGARMGPSNDMGFTWGHYDSIAKDAHGETVKTSGRYMTIWKKMQDGSWKVELESSAEEPQDAGACCTLPKP